MHRDMQSVQMTEVQWAGPESEVIDMSGCSRHKRAPCDIGALNGCLCGHVVNLDVALDRPAISVVMAWLGLKAAAEAWLWGGSGF